LAANKLGLDAQSRFFLMLGLGNAAPARPTTRFAANCERFIILLGVCTILLLGLHYFSFDDRVTINLAARYDSGRVWRADEPARSDANQALEQRLNEGLDRMELAAQGLNSTTWNKTIWQSWKNSSLMHWLVGGCS